MNYVGREAKARPKLFIIYFSFFFVLLGGTPHILCSLSCVQVYLVAGGQNTLTNANWASRQNLWSKL